MFLETASLRISVTKLSLLEQLVLHVPNEIRVVRLLLELADHRV
jgi:hypothetical protein